MFNGFKVLGVIPARGGSKELPGKNIKLLAGKPLITWTIEEASKSKYIDRLVLSSDDKDIIEVVKATGKCDIPFVRPSEISRDDSPGVESILHAIDEIPGYDLVVMLQPTSPLRKIVDIDACIEKCASSEINSCVTVTNTEKSPYWMYEVDNAGKMMSILPQPEGFFSRQLLPQVYSLNGAIYAAKIDWLRKQGDFFSAETYAYIMPRERSVDIDTELDLIFCETLLKHGES